MSKTGKTWAYAHVWFLHHRSWWEEKHPDASLHSFLLSKQSQVHPVINLLSLMSSFPYLTILPPSSLQTFSKEVHSVQPHFCPSSASGLPNCSISTLRWGHQQAPRGGPRAGQTYQESLHRVRPPWCSCLFSLVPQRWIRGTITLYYFLSASPPSSPFLLFLNLITTHFILRMKLNASRMD